MLRYNSGTDNKKMHIQYKLMPFASGYCRERNFNYLSWLCTWTCGAGRPHVGLCPHF